jgi:hypothetical protein
MANKLKAEFRMTEPALFAFGALKPALAADYRCMKQHDVFFGNIIRQAAAPAKFYGKIDATIAAAKGQAQTQI